MAGPISRNSSVAGDWKYTPREPRFSKFATFEIHEPDHTHDRQENFATEKLSYRKSHSIDA